MPLLAKTIVRKSDTGPLFEDRLAHFLMIILMLLSNQVAHFFRIKWLTFWLSKPGSKENVRETLVCRTPELTPPTAHQPVQTVSDNPVQ